MSRFENTKHLVTFLTETLIPDCDESGMDGMSDTLTECVETINMLVEQVEKAGDSGRCESRYVVLSDTALHGFPVASVQRGYSWAAETFLWDEDDQCKRQVDPASVKRVPYWN